MKYFKAFGKGMICRGKQYQENTVYEENGNEICEEGMMHFCETPFDTLDYYPLVDENGDFSEFAEVEPLDEVVEKDNKRASKKIRIGAKLSFKEFIKAGVDVLIETTNSNNIKNTNKLSDNGGDGVKIGSSGYRAQIGSSGDRAQIGSSGDRAKIGSSGDWAKIGLSGDRAQIGSSGDYAQIGLSGDRAQIGSSGDWAQIKMEGKRNVAAAVGYNCSISGKKGDWITLAEWKQDDEGWYPACVRSAQIDGETLMEDVPYKLEDGEFVRAE